MDTTVKVKKVMKPHRFHPAILKMAAERCKKLGMNRSEYLSELIEQDFQTEALKPKKK